MEEVKQLSDVEMAFGILQQVNRPMYFRDLISQVLEAKSGRSHALAHAMAQIHTQINLDSRFIYHGKGMWGLNEWVPQRGIVAVEEKAAVPSTAATRRAKLLAEIQQQDQDQVAATTVSEGAEERHNDE